jgi:hypothetical protein
MLQSKTRQGRYSQRGNNRFVISPHISPLAVIIHLWLAHDNLAVGKRLMAVSAQSMPLDI